MQVQLNQAEQSTLFAFALPMCAVLVVSVIGNVLLFQQLRKPRKGKAVL